MATSKGGKKPCQKSTLRAKVTWEGGTERRQSMDLARRHDVDLERRPGMDLERLHKVSSERLVSTYLGRNVDLDRW